jgi:hypothetical protein
MTNQEVDRIRQRIDATAPIKAYRFEGDKLSTAAKFQCFQKAFNEAKDSSPAADRIQLNTIPGPGHSVLTLDFVDAEGHPTHTALNEIIDYFGDQLR